MRIGKNEGSQSDARRRNVERGSTLILKYGNADSTLRALFEAYIRTREYNRSRTDKINL